MRRKKQVKKVPACLKQLREKTPPAELADQELLLEGLRQGELTFVGKYRGLGPSYALALDYALAHEGAFSRRRQMEIFRLWRNKCRIVSLAGKKGAHETSLKAVKGRADILKACKKSDIRRLESGVWSVNHLAQVLHKRKGVEKSVPTIRRYLRNYMISKGKKTK